MRRLWPIVGCALTAFLLLPACEETRMEQPGQEQELEEQPRDPAAEQTAGTVEAQQPSTQGSQRARLMNEISSAVAVLHPTEGNEARGTVRFEQTADGVRVVADIQGLEPNSEHGFHVHEHGDCSAPDGTSAGGHFAPDDHEHQLPPESPRHAGDMGNIEADGEGNAHLEQTFDSFSVAGEDAPALGRGVIVHARRDTGEGASGEAGPRIACGVVGAAGSS